MRYDAMIATALSIDPDGDSACAIQWRQLLDILTQGRSAISAELRAAALTRLASLRPHVPSSARARAGAQLSGRVRDVDVAALFATDEPLVSGPVLRTLELDDNDWQTLIAVSSPVSRALLRHRRDLPERARLALAAFGSSDFGLPAGATGAEDRESTQIRALVDRIAAFRSGIPDIAAVTEVAAAENFAFQCDVLGICEWVAGAPREPLIGLNFGEPADPGGYGVDAHAASAFKRRAPVRNARLSVAGDSPAGGQWLFSASPVFNPRDGRFAGYQGTARRPRRGEIAGPPARFGGTTLPVDSLRQLIHELRTPLNAVLGFAAMIDQQLLGPAAHAYQERAHAIVADGQRLLDMIEDLDHAARPRASRAEVDTVDAGQIVRRAAAALDASAQVTIDAAGSVPVAADARVVERIVTRLLSPMIALAGDDERIGVAIVLVDDRPSIVVGRAAITTALDDAALFDRAGSNDSDAVQLRGVGLGFALRLVQNMARSAGGRLIIERNAFVVSLPGPQVADSLPAGIPRE